MILTLSERLNCAQDGQPRNFGHLDQFLLRVQFGGYLHFFIRECNNYRTFLRKPF